jgi:hypothetical protein
MGHTLMFGHTAIAYTTERRPARRTFSVVFDPEQGVIVLAPADADDAEVARLVRAKATWIVKQQAELATVARAYARRYVSGESYYYLGRCYQLELRRGAGTEVKLVQGRFQVQVPGTLPALERPAWVRDQLRAWYRAKADERLAAITERWALRVGAHPQRVLVREQRKRWGSCDVNGTLRLNWRLVMAPVSLIEYVVVHELCHLRHRHHSPAFWRRLRALLPDYAARRERLYHSGSIFLL